MARWRSDADPVPEELARFVPSEWPMPDPAWEWGQACKAWLAANPGRGLPWNPEGDPIEVLIRVLALQRELRLAGVTPARRVLPWAG